jgi:hypothetical protein
LLKKFPEFDSLPAAQRGRIHIVGANEYFARPGPRIVDSLEILAGILHPEHFPEFIASPGAVRASGMSCPEFSRPNQNKVRPIPSNSDYIRRGKNMKSLALIIAIGLGMALAAVAQTTDKKQEPNPQPRAKTKTEENVKAKPATTKQSVQPNERDGTRTNVDQNVSINKGARMKSKEKLGGNALFRRSRVNVETGAVSHSTTLFRSGRETHESLSLHRGFRDRSDVHFSIGTHPREWSLRTYSIVVMDGFHYYLGDNGCSHPPYGFDRSCNYPDGVVFCE